MTNKLKADSQRAGLLKDFSIDRLWESRRPGTCGLRFPTYVKFDRRSIAFQDTNRNGKVLGTVDLTFSAGTVVWDFKCKTTDDWVPFIADELAFTVEASDIRVEHSESDVIVYFNNGYTRVRIPVSENPDCVIIRVIPYGD